ncbi:MAG: hypothetical protein HYZ72_17295 [Deltaproteobacteria bacterium]|nr:hypothetical protein [Deltaproteobacteria bacterium]
MGVEFTSAGGITSMLAAVGDPSAKAVSANEAATGNPFSVIRSNDQVRALALQPDGRIVVAGISDGSVRNSFALARYKPDGSVDTSFGQDGKVITRIGTDDVEVAALALQANDGLVVMGYTSNASYPAASLNLVLARYKPDGSLDASFGTNGTVTTAASLEGFSAVSGAALQADGKLVVAVRSFSTKGDFLLFRYLPNGSVDTSFGVEGNVRGSTGFQTSKLVLALQADGKILVVGAPVWSGGGAFVVVPGSPLPKDWCPGPFDGRFFLARYNADGSVDASSGPGGSHITNISQFRWISTFAFQTDRKVVIAGDADCHFALARYHPDGSPDASFGSDGVARPSKGPNGVSAVTFQPDGKLLVLGYSYDDLILTRYNPDGSLDSSFGVDGIVTIALRDAQALSLQPDGKIVVAGYVYGTDSDFALTRYKPDGSVDARFGTNGIATSNFTTITHSDDCATAIPPIQLPRAYRGEAPPVLRDEASAVVLQPGGELVVAGTADYALALLRYSPNGSVDTSFGAGGAVTTRISTHEKYADLASALALQHDGKILVTGAAWRDMSYRFFLVRYTTDGALDMSFGTAGKATPSVGVGGSAIRVQPDGRIVVAAGPTGGWPRSWFLVRFLTDGNLDSSFGSGGMVPLDFEDLRTSFFHPDGKLVVAGLRVIKQTKSRVYLDFILERYSLDGSVDVSFGTQGKVKLDTWNEKIYPFSFALQPDGKIVGGGLIPYNKDLNGEFVLVRYNADGSPDTNFGTEGRIALLTKSLVSMRENEAGLFMPRYSGSGFRRVIIQDDGKIVAIGTAENNFVMFRYNPDGGADTSFGNGGKVTTLVGARSDRANALTLQKDGKIVVAGACANARHTNIALLRYNADGSLDSTFSADGKVTTHIGSGIPAVP